MNKLFKNYFLIVVSVLVLVSIDQIIKYIIRLRQPAKGGFYICNRGISFGIELPESLIWAIYGIIGLGLIYLIFRRKHGYNFISLTLILGGGLSNMIDRLRFGCVIDYIDIRIWPVFNLADVSICAGAFVLLIRLLNKKNRI